jgi:hypothetical protein
MKECPKCKAKHNKIGVFCSRPCANGRAHSKTTKDKIGDALRGRYRGGQLTTARTSDITGDLICKNSNRSFWDSPCKGRFVKKLAGWFNITLGIKSQTEQDLNRLREQIRHLYEDLNLSSIEIKEYLNIPLPNGHMPAFLKQLGIDRRTLSSAINNAILTGRSTPNSNYLYKTGWHTDSFGGSHYYRSSYELQLYKVLDAKRRKYETEKLRIKYYDTQNGRYRIVVPDIVIGRLIIEVKSNFTFDFQNMEDKFTEYRSLGYRPVLVLDGKIWWFHSGSNRDTSV